MRAILGLSAASFLAACATITIPARMYDMKDGAVLAASFDWKGDTKGPVRIAKPAGDSCNGEYRTIVGGATTVGTGISSGGWGTLFTSVYSTTTIEKAQKGFALATCPGGHVFECEYITNVRFTTVDGHGVCKDNRGATYRLLF